MYEWYFGKVCCPEKHERRNAMAEMIASIGGFTLLVVGGLVLTLMFPGGI